MLILGASARAAAQSARRAGFIPHCGDLFADRDLRRCATVARPGNYPGGLEAIADAAPRSGWMYTGGLENHPPLVDRIAVKRPLYGNGDAVLKAVRDPFRLAEEFARGGIPFPLVRQGPGGVPADGSWLSKPRAGSGGIGIHAWKGPDRAGGRRRMKTRFLQQFIPGQSLAAVYLAAGGEAALLGVTRQLIGAAWTGADGFRYAGSIGPLDLSTPVREQFERIGRRLSRSFGLAGLFGVDAIQAGEIIWPIEVNPRYTASIEVLERAQDCHAVRWHVEACRAGRLPTLPGGRRRAWCGKAVLYARKDLIISAEFAEYAEAEIQSAPWPGLADLPDAGAAVRAGLPITTVLAEAESEAELMQKLRARSSEAEQLLYADSRARPGL